VVTVTSEGGQFQIERTALVHKDVPESYDVSFDEVSPHWYLTELVPTGTKWKNTAYPEDYPDKTYFILNYLDDGMIYQFNFTDDCPDSEALASRAIRQVDNGCSFEDYATLKANAIAAIAKLDFRPEKFVPSEEPTSPALHFLYTLTPHEGPIPWQRPPDMGFGDLAILGYSVVTVFGLIILTLGWLVFRRLRARRPSE
jgi:hypothetical protein